MVDQHLATIFDALKLARKLEAAGVPQRQAADTAEALADSLGEASDLATSVAPPAVAISKLLP